MILSNNKEQGSENFSESKHQFLSSNDNNNEIDFQNNNDTNIEDLSSSYSSSTSGEFIQLSDSNSAILSTADLNMKLVDSIEQFRLNFIDSMTSDKNIEQYDKEYLRELSKPLQLDSDDICMTETLRFRLLARHLRITEKDLFDCNKKHNLDSQNISGSSALEKSCSQLEKLELEDEKISIKAIEEATQNLKEFLKFCYQHKIVDLSPESFPKEFYELSGIFSFGYDKNNYPLVWISSRVHRKWSARFDQEFKHYVAWHFHCMTNSILERQRGANSTYFESFGRKDMFVLVFDCYEVGVASIDIEFLKMIVYLLLTAYPSRCKYAIVKDIPWIFRSVWNLVKTWLPESSTRDTKLISGKELINFIDVEHLPLTVREHSTVKSAIKNLPGNSLKERESSKIRLPKNFESLKDIDEFAKDLELSESEVKKFKNHVTKITDEYKKIGAL